MSITFAGHPDHDEHTRRLGNRARALEALQAAGATGVLNTALMAIAGSRAGGRVDELRDLGYVIDCERVRAGLFRYTLRTSPTRGTLASLQPVAYLDARGFAQSLTPATDPQPRAEGRLF